MTRRGLRANESTAHSLTLVSLLSAKVAARCKGFLMRLQGLLSSMGFERPKEDIKRSIAPNLWTPFRLDQHRLPAQIPINCELPNASLRQAREPAA